MLLPRVVPARRAKHVLCNVQPLRKQRNASLTSSISRGVRKAAAALGQAEKRRVREGSLGFWELKDQDKVIQARDNALRRRREEFDRKSHLTFLASDSESPAGPKDQDNAAEDVERKRTRATARARGVLVDAPLAVPYTEAAAEFLYGTFAVLAALRARRRRFYKLYIWCGEDGNMFDDDPQTTEIVRNARTARVPVVRVAGSWGRMLDKMSDRRPHNGLVLEAAAIPKLAVKCLDEIKLVGDPATVTLNHISPAEREDFGIPLKSSTYALPRTTRTKKYPFLLWLDKVTDTGNMGAVFRSAYFLGVDAIILPVHGTAPLSAVTIKNSAGAAEQLPILTIDKELDFMQQSQKNGWIFYAAGATTSKSTVNRTGPSTQSHPPETVLQSRPCVLILGNEGEGLRTFVQKQADHSIAIEGVRSDSLIDSLNVSVAAALLTHRFLSG